VDEFLPARIRRVQAQAAASQQAERVELDGREQLFRTLANSIPQLAWMADQEGYIFWYNDRWYEYTGTTLEQMRGWGWQKVHHPDEVGRVVERIKVAFATGEPWEDTFPLRSKTGEYRWFLSRALPIRDADGRVVRWFGTNTDITEQMEMQQALRESEQQFRTLANSIPQMAWMADHEGYRFWYNDRWYDYTGTTFEQMQGWGWQKVHHPEELDRVVKRMKIVFAAGEPWEDTFPLRGRTGEYRWFLSRALPIRDADGRVVHWFGTNTDITEYRQMEKELRESRDDLEARVMERTAELSHANKILKEEITERKRMEETLNKLNEELEQRVQERTAELDGKARELETFAYSVAHDLKAPLRGIDGYSRLLLESGIRQLDEDNRTLLFNIRASTERMNQLIDDLLSYSRLERRALTTSAFELRPFISALIEEKRAELEHRKIEFSLHIANGTVVADAESLAQAFRNYLDNAIKFTGRAEQPRIEIGTKETDRGYRLWVRDNGIGFDNKYQDRIFEIFQRLNRLEDYPGTGIGLALVRKAMERMGGRAWAESAVGKGATFYLEIPKSHI